MDSIKNNTELMYLHGRLWPSLDNVWIPVFLPRERGDHYALLREKLVCTVLLHNELQSTPTVWFESTAAVGEEDDMDLERKRLLRLGEVLKFVALSRSEIYLLVKQGDFPSQVKLGPRAVAWRAQDIYDWIESRGSAR